MGTEVGIRRWNETDDDSTDLELQDFTSIVIIQWTLFVSVKFESLFSSTISLRYTWKFNWPHLYALNCVTI